MKNNCFLSAFLGFLFFLLLNGNSSFAQKNVKTDNTKIHPLVEQIPGFPGGETERNKFFEKNLQYPQKEKELGISGTTYVKFTIDTAGTIMEPTVGKTSGNKQLDYEAIRLVKFMPKWNPAKQAGKPVAVNYSIPVTFETQKKKVDERNPVINENEQDVVFSIVEQMPQFPGGTNEMLNFISKNCKNIKTEKTTGIKNNVFVAFVVNRDGDIKDVEIVSGGNSGDTARDNEALRVVKSMPKWTPGKQNGKTVSVLYVCTIKF